MNITDELQKLQTLRDSGAVTEAEFNQLKTRLLQGDLKTTSSSASDLSSAKSFIHSIGRSRSDSWIGGVCGGLAKKVGLPTWALRLGFTAALFLTGGFIGFIYLLLWVFVPLEA